jgi:hypothetical protein
MLTLEVITMMRQRVDFRRVLSLRQLIFVMLIAMGMMVVGAVRADDAATTAPAAGTDATATQAGPTNLQQSVKDFWFYGKVARYDLANIEGQKILSSGAQPREVLEAFEKMLDSQTTALNRQKDNLDEWMLRWANLDAMKDITAKIQDVLNQGYLTRKSDPDFIKHEIERLSVNQRAYQSAMKNLRQSGELAIPFMLDYLRDPSKAQYQAAIRLGMRDLGKYGLNALVAATYSTDGDVLVAVIDVLGDIGYDSAVPYLARVANDSSLPGGAHDAANKALARLNITAPTSVADSFYSLAEKQYYGSSSIASDTRNPMAFVWYWDSKTGLSKTDVPHTIFNDVMAMRQTEASLKAGASQSNALSLWLTANYKRQISLKEGEKDATRPANYPDANYWGVTAGASYLNDALARALKDRDSGVAMVVIGSLQQIVGQSNMLTGSGNEPLVDAMAFPDRLVRFEAAFALAAALPQKAFTGQERVVPLLGEALSQTGQSSVVVIMPNQEALNALVDGLKTNGIGAVGATTSEAAIDQANNMTSIDAFIISDDMSAAEVDKLFSLGGSNPKLKGAAKIIMVKTEASPYMQRAISDPIMSVTLAKDAAGLKIAIPEAMKRAGTLNLNTDVGTKYALRSGALLEKLAISRGQVLDISAAKVSLLSALNDARPEVVKLAGQTLGLINDKDAQSALLGKASDDKTADDVKISLYGSLATSAKFYGNQLDEPGVKTLSGIVESAQNLDVRSAAAEARGALNLPAEQAKSLVIGQSKN